MLTGENTITSGDAYVNGWSVKNNWREAGANVGYCPQYDAIIKEMSGEETLYMFARIRGIPERDVPVKVRIVFHANRSQLNSGERSDPCNWNRNVCQAPNQDLFRR